MHNMVAIIARRIRATRLERNLTLQQVADRSQVSKGLVSRIENARTVPSLPVFLSLVDSLGLTVKDFFGDIALSNGKSYILVTKSELSTFDRESRKGFEYFPIISHPIPASTLQCVLLKISPDCRSIPSTTDGLELKYMIAGSCDYLIGDERITLHEGDTLLFDGAQPHAPLNPYDDTAVMFVVYFLKTTA